MKNKKLELGHGYISPDYLSLDRENPRLFLPSMTPNTTEMELIKALADNSDLKELVFSIANNGFLDMEPLIVMVDKNKTGNYKVLEGNRRLAAIKLIKDKEIANKARIKVPDMTSEQMDTLKEVSVYLVNNEEQARGFIGFKHVNGPHKWDSYAKAQFAYRWYKEEKDIGVTIDDIARKLGDTNKTVQALVSSMFLIEQAQARGLYDLNDRTTERFALSHFYTALGRKEYMDFLGLERGWNSQISENPVSAEYESNLREVLVGLYGSKEEGRESVIKSQNPDVKKFGEILSNPKSLMAYKSGASFEDAYYDTGDANGKISEALIGINALLDKSSVLLDKVDSLDAMNNQSIIEMRNKFEKIEFQASKRMKK